MTCPVVVAVLRDHTTQPSLRWCDRCAEKTCARTRSGVALRGRRFRRGAGPVAGRSEQGGYRGPGMARAPTSERSQHEARPGGRELLAPGGSGDRRGARGDVQRAIGGQRDSAQYLPGGTTSIRGSAQGPDGLQQPELRPGGEEDEPGAFNRPRPGFKNGKFPKKPLDAPTVASSRDRRRRTPSSCQRQRADPPRPAAGQRRQPVLARAARPGALRRQRLRGRGGEQRHPGAQHGDRRAADRRRRTSTRSSATPRPINRTTGVIGPNVIDPVCHYDPDNNRFMVVITTLHVRRERRLQRQEHDRPRRVQHRRPDRRLDDLPRAGPERRHRRARPNHGCTLDGDDARARASRTTRTSAATRTASTSRPTSTTCSGRASTPPRSSPSPRRSWPRTRRRST